MAAWRRVFLVREQEAQSSVCKGRIRDEVEEVGWEPSGRDPLMGHEKDFRGMSS